jgi:protein-S-isoprenylcysteine O-methyltransferase Ste14
VPTVRNVNKIDVGRLIIVPIFAFLMTINILVVYQDLKTLLPISTIKATGLIHHLLIVSFYSLIIFLYFLRGPTRSTSRSHVTNFLAVIATFIPFTLPFLGKPALNKPEILLIANVIIIISILLSIYALGSLGKSFSIIPQARKLIKTGPYRVVRHPLYVSELIGVFGLVLAGLTFLKIAIFLLLVVLQVYRAFQEEKLLAKIFPEYREYSSKTARFIPGII